MTDLTPDAMAALRTTFHALPPSLARLLRVEAPDFLQALNNVLILGTQENEHIEAPRLRPGDLTPEEIPNFFVDGDFDVEPPRHLHDVWQGKGDYNDPMIPQDRHEHELILARMASDPEAVWPGGTIGVATSETKTGIYGVDSSPSGE